MPTTDGQVRPEDVERVQEQILEARAQRKRVEEAFDAFTSGFRTRQLQTDDPGDDPPEILFSSSAAPVVTEPNAEAVEDGMPLASVRPRRVRRRTGPMVAVVGAAVVGAAIFAVLGRPAPEVAAPEAALPTAASTASSPQPPADTPVAVAKPAAPSAAEASGVSVVLTTRRRVWMRVTLDGQRAFEREVAADEQIPLHAERSIVIRAGDAGAVAVTRNGRDVGPVGRDGVVATREFTRDAPASR